MEDRITKTKKMSLYIVNTYFICVAIYFLVSKFILKADVTQYSVIEKLVLLSAPIAQLIITTKKKLYYATIFWIFACIISLYALFFL